MELFKEIMNYASVAITIILTIVYLILSHSKTKKTKLSNGILNLIEKIPFLIENAEQMFKTENGEKKGANKLDYVLTQIQLFALQNGITYDLEAIKDYVNNLVAVTKKVNTFPIVQSGTTEDTQN